jgi:NAD(P)H-hydrate repair Nnr-like enzyme with NAD(P)H-hydrate dehydratase domain
MATAGSGDILTGIIAGVIAQGVAPFEGTALAAFVHAEAGSRAAGPRNQPIIATDMLAMIPEILAHSPSG